MFGGGRGPMGGGGGMLRAASRAMTRTGVGGIADPLGSSSSSSSSGATHGGVQKKLGSSSSSSNLTITAVNGSSLNLPVAATSGWNGGAFSFVNSGGYEDFEWVSDEASEGEDSPVFGSVPSVDEVHDAVSALQQVFDGSSRSQVVRDGYASNSENGGGNQVYRVPSSGSESDWMEPSIHFCHSRIVQSNGLDQVYNAFDLLRTEPSVQRMVMSLSSDKAVWEAVMNNQVVREIRDLYNNGISEGEEGSDETLGKKNATADFVKWIFSNTMVKATELFEKITKVVAQLVSKHNGDSSNKKGKDAKFNNWLDERLKTSVLLSIVVLLVVMVSRACSRS